MRDLVNCEPSQSDESIAAAAAADSANGPAREPTNTYENIRTRDKTNTGPMMRKIRGGEIGGEKEGKKK